MEKKAYCPAISEDVEYFGAKEVVKAELDAIRQRRRDPALQTAALHGIALSGGGIRSASFSLGVMQALAHNGWLATIDYLSTVSGGGYIGSSLTWSLNSDPKTFGLTDKNFPFTSFPMGGEPRDEAERTELTSLLRARKGKSRWSGRLLNFLRQNAKYLTPGRGLNLFALLWAALRGASLGLLVYGALITLVFLLAFQFGLLREVCAFAFLPEALRQNWFLFAAVLGFGLGGLTVPLYSLAAYFFRRRGRWAYPLREVYDRTAGRLLPILLALLLLGSIPWVHDWVQAQGEAARSSKAGQVTVSGNILSAEGELTFQGTMRSQAVAGQPPAAASAPKEQPPAQASIWAKLWGHISAEATALWAGLGTFLVGLISGIMTYLKTKSVKPGKVPMGLLVTVGVGALLFGILLFAYTMALAVVQATASDPVLLVLFFCFGLAVAVPLAMLTNLNQISIHRYYRDRLMETFMPDVEKVLDGAYHASLSYRANWAAVHEMTYGPYHIINTNVVLVSSDKPKLRGRGGDSFILSPQYCGSYATGWQRTQEYMGGAMTLASAMATSGAAINPSAGCGGEGITRSPFLSILMGLLNFRLGYWVPNPKNWQNWRGRLRNPNFLLPGLWEVVFRNQLDEKGTFLQLSDGGHFENLGLYELVRRKLRLIIVCDGGADPKFTFGDLANAMEKVRTDFGALIMIDNDDLQGLIPKKGDDPCDIPCADKGYLVATIKYADNSKGILIYLTTTFFQGVSADLYGYKKEHPAFPDESTGDQFFDEKQFEAYRELGFQAAWTMMLDVVHNNEVAKRIWPQGFPARG
ncbi:MAG TPA: patatin-like phospholipase family protein [Desulfurivibrionaceae bacterium]|nr:patatin-like phospholipase family protein [Desulfurivibrionaceae bacterium]